MTAKAEAFHDPLREAHEFRDQVGSEGRRLAFFFGAGTSQAVGIDSITALTRKVEASLTGSQKAHYTRLLTDAGTPGTVENVLDAVRLCREMIGDSASREANGFKGTEAADIDRAICRSIYQAVSKDPPKGLATHAAFAAWLRSVESQFPVEVFTTNYDLLIEKGLEQTEVPYFDGFVGSVAPYFVPATVEADISRPHPICPPPTWVRVWKIHGSIGWRFSVDPTSNQKKIVRTPSVEPGKDEDLIIFPSRQKYTDSRKQPYVAYHDRFRRLLSSGEVLLIVIGYSFGDEHINEIIFEALRANNRLAVTAFMYEPLSGKATQRSLLTNASALRNLTVYGPDQASVGGVLAPWSKPTQAAPKWLGTWPFWDEAKKSFALGDFAVFVAFLQSFLGFRNPMEDLPKKELSEAAPAASIPAPSFKPAASTDAKGAATA
jgi:hypothetical protein